MKYANCLYCDRKISLSNYSRHVSACSQNSGRELNSSSTSSSVCRFCNAQLKNDRARKQHEIRCKDNPNCLSTNTVRIGFNNPGRVAWNKGLTKDTSKSIRKAAITYASNRRAGKHKQLAVNSMDSIEVRARHKAKMKEIYAKYHKGHTKGFKQGYYKNIWCDSSWELAYLIYLYEHNIPVHRNKEGFKYEWEGNEHTYFPDFYLDECKYFVEIKGYMSERDTSKISQFPYPIIILQENEMLPILEYVETKYGKDFIQLYDN